MIQIPQLDEKLMSFISMPSEHDEKAFNQMDEEIDKLKSLFSKCEEKVLQTNNKFVEYHIEPSHYISLPHEIRFLISFQKRLVNKYYLKLKKSFNACIEKISHVIGFMNFCSKMKIYACIDLEKFIDYLIEIRDNICKPKIHTYPGKITRLNNKLDFIIPLFLDFFYDPKIYTRLISRSIQAIQPNKFLSLNQLNEFDDFFPGYLNYHNSFDKILSLIENINQQKKCEEALQQLINLYSTKFGIHTPEGTILLKTTLIRLAYSESYFIHSPFQKLSPLHDTFFRKCSNVISYSPAELCLNKNYFTEIQYTAPILNLLQSSEIKIIVGLLNSVQFYSNPFDIQNILCKVSFLLDEFAKMNEMNRKIGKFAWIAENKQIRPSFLAFDDLFSFYIIILALKPPINSLEISKWLESSPEFSKNMYTSQAKMLFISATYELANFTLQKFTERSIISETDSDPLGISSFL